MEFGPKFWILVSTVIFVALIAKPLGRVLGASLDKRAQRIQQELDEAVQLREEAQAMLASYQRKQKQALEESEQMIEHAKSESDRIIRAARRQMEEDFHRRTDLALQKIEQAEARASQDIRENAVEVTMKTARELILDHLHKKRADAILEDAINEAGTKFH